MTNIELENIQPGDYLETHFGDILTVSKVYIKNNVFLIL